VWTKKFKRVVLTINKNDNYVSTKNEKKTKKKGLIGRPGLISSI